MHIVNCEHPLTIYNKYLRRTVQVSCGKCVPCRNARIKRWVSRLQQETRCWRYCFELYLDYNDDMLPTYDFAPDGIGSTLVERQRRFYVSSVKDDKLVISLSSLLTGDKKSDDYVLDRLNSHYTGLPHPSVRDIQLFKKRLTKYIYGKFGLYRSFRSAIAAEIGPTTFRPHYHGIIWFNDPRLSSEISSLVCKAWQDGNSISLGHAYAKPDRGGTVSYVTKYICRPTDLPACYSSSALSTFFLTSRKPPIGSLLESTEEVRKIFFAASPQRVGSVLSQGKYRPVPFPHTESFENRLFPKCPLYGEISVVNRIELYKSVLGNKGLISDYDDYLFHVTSRIYDFGIFPDCSNALPTSLGQCKPSVFAELIFNVTHGFESWDSLRVLHSIGKRIYFQSEIFGVSFDFYLNQIFKYYDNKEILKLRSFYSFQSDYLADGNSLEDVFCMYQFASPCGAYASTSDYKSFISDEHFKYEDGLKTIKKNAYFESLKVKDTNLYQLVCNYYE